MIALAGILIVLGAVLGGFLMENRSLRPLMQPAELLIIAGAGLGAMLAANPVPRLARTVRSLRGVFRSPTYSNEKYLSTLVMLYSVLYFARHHSAGALEDAIEEPRRSALFVNQPGSAGNPEVIEFVCDTLRLSVLGAVSPYDMGVMIENDLAVRRHEGHGPVESLETLSDSLPGFGIVAAVLGVILAMGSMREAPILIGVKIAAALIGTFMGILLAYGFVSPISARIAKIENAEAEYFESIGAGLAAFAKGVPAAIAVECARRAIPPEVRPDFEKTEQACRQALHRPVEITRPQTARY
ncbi:MAG TPA: motility-associated protein [Bryobacteraceae bacterium]|nr:motility-associated protein [Bryobacteraceae bacterium]